MNLSTSQITYTKFRKVSIKIVSEMKRLEVPGVAIGIHNKGKEFTAGFGITSVDHPLPVTEDTLFQTGSISKTFTGTLLMMLVEQGIVDLDAPVRKYIKDFKVLDESVSRKVTVRQLLTHMGGWVGDYFNDFGNGEDALDKMVKDLAKLPQIQPLNSIWSYNNTGFNVAARIVEVVTKKPYEQAVQEMIFDPLGLDMTYFYPSDILFTHRFVVGHKKVKGNVKVARPWALGRAGNGVGGVVSTVRDLLKYARFHMSNGMKNVITGKSLRAMRVRQVSAGPRGDMGITWFIRDAGKFKVYAHGGATNGQQAYFFFIPDKDFACAILTNSDDGSIISAGIYSLVLETYFKVTLKMPEPIDVPVKELKEYAGRYKIGIECFDIKVKDKYLMYHHIPLGGFPTPDTPPGPAMPPMRFQFYEKDKVIGLDEPYKGTLGDILRDKDGHMEYFRVGGRAHVKVKGNMAIQSKEHLVDIGNTHLFVSERGNGYPLFVLHGGPGLDHNEFGDYLDPLCDQFRLILVDQRAQGKSQPCPEITWTLEQMAKDVFSLAKALELNQYAVLGHSYGAFVALQNAVDFPGAASHTVVSGGVPSARFLSVVAKNLDKLEPIEIREQVKASWDREASVETQEEFAELMHDQMPFHFGNPFDPRIKEYEERTRETVYSPAVLRQFAQAEYGGIEVEDRLKNVTQPVLVCTGRMDRVCTLEAAEAMAKGLPHAELVIFEKSGHMTFVEENERYLQIVRDFLNR